MYSVSECKEKCFLARDLISFQKCVGRMINHFNIVAVNRYPDLLYNGLAYIYFLFRFMFLYLAIITPKS